jgi:Ca2+-binding EF-hand superfamily protein
MNPDEMFNRYSGGQDSFNVNEMAPDQRERFMRMAQFTGFQIPPNGIITRDYYRQATEQMRERFSQMRGGMGGPPGSMMMSAPGGGGPPVMPMSSTPSGSPNQPSIAPQMPGAPSPWGGGSPPQWGGGPGGWNGGQQGGWNGGQSGGWGGGGPGGFDPNQMSDEQIGRMMRRYDRDGDGRISAEEASGDLRDAFQRLDTNRDGYIDANEYRVYLMERMGDRNRGDRGSSGFDPNNQQNPQWGGPPGGWGGGDRSRDQRDQEPERPVVYRYGKLPKDLPSWFTSLDEDQDGQIGLYEWRADGRSIAEFQAMDLNGDGIITAEEYLRYRREKDGGDNRSASVASQFGVDRGGSDRSNDRGNRFGGFGGTSGGDRMSGPPGGDRRPNRGNESTSQRDDRPRDDRRDTNGPPSRSGSSGGNPFRGR